jgi:hypothetical protein
MEEHGTFFVRETDQHKERLPHTESVECSHSTYTLQVCPAPRGGGKSYMAFKFDSVGRSEIRTRSSAKRRSECRAFEWFQ